LKENAWDIDEKHGCDRKSVEGKFGNWERLRGLWIGCEDVVSGYGGYMMAREECSEKV
jgi:hypothetical protein